MTFFSYLVTPLLKNKKLRKIYKKDIFQRKQKLKSTSNITFLYLYSRIRKLNLLKLFLYQTFYKLDF